MIRRHFQGVICQIPSFAIFLHFSYIQNLFCDSVELPNFQTGIQFASVFYRFGLFSRKLKDIFLSQYSHLPARNCPSYSDSDSNKHISGDESIATHNRHTFVRASPIQIQA